MERERKIPSYQKNSNASIMDYFSYLMCLYFLGMFENVPELNLQGRLVLLWKPEEPQAIWVALGQVSICAHPAQGTVTLPQHHVVKSASV